MPFVGDACDLRTLELGIMIERRYVQIGKHMENNCFGCVYFECTDSSMKKVRWEVHLNCNGLSS